MQASTKKLIMLHVKNYQPVIGHKSSMKEGQIGVSVDQTTESVEYLIQKSFGSNLSSSLPSYINAYLLYLKTKTRRQTSMEKYMHSKIFCNWNHWINFFQYGFKNSNPGYLIHIMEFHLEIGNLMENYDEFAILHCFLRPPW